MDHAARHDLRIGERLAHGAHAGRGHVAGLQKLFPFVGGPRQHDLLQRRDLAGVVGVALIVGSFRHLRAPEHGP
jgi:hypothetical protein